MRRLTRGQSSHRNLSTPRRVDPQRPNRLCFQNSPVDLPPGQTYTLKGPLSGRFAHFFVVMSKGVEWDRVRRLIQDIVEGQGYELVDVEFKGAGKNSILRIFIDEPAGISHRDCELV